MKIGILTFHWATNYGAVLQSYALQSYLEGLGHEVEIINYKPRQYDYNTCGFFRSREFLRLKDYSNKRKREYALSEFREKYLHQTDRVSSFRSLEVIASHYDAIISGSDQVLNPSFLLSGEGNGIITPTYFLGFPFKGKRIGYALSFGCVAYPENAKEIASKFIKDFDFISVRENTGVEIIKSMGRDDVYVVPDPTLLMDVAFYNNLADEGNVLKSVPYVYCFFIRNVKARKSSVNPMLMGRNFIWNNEDGDYTMQGWLSKIKNADFVVTDSFHCVVMCLKFHTPFIVVTADEGNVGMNDRLYTLLTPMNLTNKIIYWRNLIWEDFDISFDFMWDEIDCELLNKFNLEDIL